MIHVIVAAKPNAAPIAPAFLTIYLALYVISGMSARRGAFTFPPPHGRC
jgi:hypothetical protein